MNKYMVKNLQKKMLININILLVLKEVNYQEVKNKELLLIEQFYKILILNEATSALVNKSEKKVSNCFSS